MKTEKPWGQTIVLFRGEIPVKTGFTDLLVQRIMIDGDQMTSLHVHKEKNEILLVEKGTLYLKIDGEIEELGKGERYFIEKGKVHQLQNLEQAVLEVLEVSLPYNEADFERLEDPYADER